MVTAFDFFAAAVRTRRAHDLALAVASVTSIPSERVCELALKNALPFKSIASLNSAESNSNLRSLHLLYKPWSQLVPNDANSAPAARSTRLNIVNVFGSASATFWTNDLAIDFHLNSQKSARRSSRLSIDLYAYVDLGSEVEFLKCHVNVQIDFRALFLGLSI